MSVDNVAKTDDQETSARPIRRGSSKRMRPGRARVKPEEPVERPHCVLVPVYGKDGRRCAFATVDRADYPLVSGRHWRAQPDGRTTYALSKRGDAPPQMHRLILGLRRGDGQEVDHINRDGLDNRRRNLRVVPHSANALNRRTPKNNTSGFRGVSYYAPRKYWIAAMRVGGKSVLCSAFKTRDEAIACRLNAERLHGVAPAALSAVSP